MNNITPTKIEKEATFAQSGRLIDFFKEKNVTAGKLQDFFGAGDLISMMLECQDLKIVSREEFLKLMTVGQMIIPAQSGLIQLTPHSELAARIKERSDERKWGYTDLQIEKFAAAVYSHKGDLHPTTADMWLGGDFAYNWAELVLWFKDELKKFGLELKEDPRPSTLDFTTGSEITGDLKLEPITLDIKTYWSPHIKGFAIADVQPKHKKWPSLQPLIFHCLNPQLFGKGVVDGKLFPDFLVLGISFDEEVGGYTRIGRSEGRPCIQYKDLIVEGQQSTSFQKIKTSHTWFGASMVGFGKP